MLNSCQMSSFSDVFQTVEPEFVHEGWEDCCPLPGDAPNIMSAEFQDIKAIDGSKEEGDKGFDQSYSAEKTIKGELNYGHFTNISIPFSSSFPMKAAYYLLPVDLSDVVLCEISGKGRSRDCFGIKSLVFFREKSPEELLAQEVKKKLWSEAPVVKPEFVKKGDKESHGRKSIPIPRDDPHLVDPLFSMVKCKDDSKRKESLYYDQSSRAQRMLKGEDDVRLSHLSIPFPSPSPLKAAYICVDKDDSSPSLLFTFTDCDRKKIFKKYEFPKPKYRYQWYFLPIDLNNIVLCEIEGKGILNNHYCRYFRIQSLVFIRGDDNPNSSPLLTPVPSSYSRTPTSTLPLPSKPVRAALKEEEDDAEERQEVVIIGNGKGSAPKDTKQKKPQDKKKHNPKDGKPKHHLLDSSLASSFLPEKSSVDQDSGPKDDKILPKHDSLTLTSASTITPQCIIGRGTFGEVLLVKVNGLPFPCVLKKILRVADKKVVKGCRKEFKVQLKLFTNPKCFNHIPRPLYILDLLDADFHGVYGFLMEFCVGGSVSSFAKSWCAAGKYVSVDDVFRAERSLVHRDVKPDNFLVRIGPKDGECTVVLSDLGMVRILDSISSSASSKSAAEPIRGEKKEKNPKHDKSRCGTLVYNSYETLLNGTQTQKSDAYSLGMSILSLFLCEQPFVSLPLVREVNRKVNLGRADDIDVIKVLIHGKYKTVNEVFNEVFTGLIQRDEDARMSVHDARKKVQTIKSLLPEIGEGFEYPSIDGIIKEQNRKHSGST
ncbi:hypothetical protein ADUPG1_012281 [Aduncisulcus paluster]|uniref:Protein kinase domain-containing protein n=1 Tax=Aduncisulcus paluster TaxID=2918883 RepID=A0ABQ5JYX0_9EUKA|nr:hypothetical protein ADUPG1_012281 [Aduncisulcus paluster]